MKNLLIVFLTLIVLVSFVETRNEKAIAQSRNKYMDLGDKYLRNAEQSFGCECTSAFGIMALAAFTAAQKE